jgi:hypothetical protein
MPPPIKAPSAKPGANFFAAQATTAAVMPVDNKDIIGLEFMEAPNIGGTFLPMLKATAAPTTPRTVLLLTPMGLRL